MGRITTKWECVILAVFESSESGAGISRWCDASGINSLPNDMVCLQAHKFLVWDICRSTVVSRED